VQGRVLLLEGDQMAPGMTGWIQVLLAEPTVLVPGDRFILRHQTPMVTLGGGEVLDVAPRKRKRAQPEVLAELQQRLECLRDPDAFFAHILGAAESPKTLAELCGETGLLPQQALGIVRNLVQKGAAVALKPDEVLISCARLEELLRRVRACINEHFQEHPALGAVERPELRRRVQLSLGAASAAYFDDLLAALKQRNEIKAESNWVALPGRERHLEGSLALQARQVEQAFAAGGLAPSHPAEIEAQLRIPPKTFKEILRFLLETGKLVQATPEVIFHQQSFENAVTATRALFAQKAELTTSEIRQHLGMNRKHVVPLVELFDRKGVTLRVADKRRLKTP
jgi:selenocysteine-specific elongation factor